MKIPAALFLRPTPASFWLWGRVVIVGAFVFGLLLVGLMTWKAPEMLFILAAALLGGVAAWYLFQYPLLNLAMIVLGMGVVADIEEGFQLKEVIYGLYLYSFLAHWWITRGLMYRERILRTVEDKVLFGFLLALPFTVILTVVFDGSLRTMFSQMLAMVMFAMYFPVKEICVRYRHGVTVFLLALAVVGVLVAFRNAFLLQQKLSAATHAWQIATGRVTMNDNVLMIGSLFAFIFLVYTRKWLSFGLMLGLFLIVFGGLVMTQSRGYWLAFMLGAGIIFLLVNTAYKKRMLGLGSLGVVALLGIGFLFFSTYMDLLLGGLLDRFSTLETATTRDVSLVNRFREASVVWTYIVKNPVIGYGMGVDYIFFDITRFSTEPDSFVHIGYVGLWYQFGLWGLGMILFLWIKSIWNGIRACRWKTDDVVAHCGVMGATACLVALMLSTNTANPFYIKDAIFFFASLCGLTNGIWERLQIQGARLAITET